MLENITITASSSIIKFLLKLDLDLFLTDSQLKHVIAFISGLGGNLGFKFSEGACYRMHLENLQGNGRPNIKTLKRLTKFIII